MRKRKNLVLISLMVLSLFAFFNVTSVQAENDNGVMGKIADIQNQITLVMEKIGLISDTVTGVKMTVTKQQNEINQLKELVQSQQNEILQLKKAVSELQNSTDPGDNDGNNNEPTQGLALVIDKYYSDGSYYVIIDVRGTLYTYKIDSAAYPNIYEDQLYNYSLDGTKVSFADAGLTFESTIIDDIDISTMSIEAGNANYQIDSDTYMYDLTGDDPIWIDDLSKLSVGDNIRYCTVQDDPNRTGVIKALFIVE